MKFTCSCCCPFVPLHWLDRSIVNSLLLTSIHSYYNKTGSAIILGIAQWQATPCSNEDTEVKKGGKFGNLYETYCGQSLLPSFTFTLCQDSSKQEALTRLDFTTSFYEQMRSWALQKGKRAVFSDYPFNNVRNKNLVKPDERKMKPMSSPQQINLALYFWKSSFHAAMVILYFHSLDQVECRGTMIC